jgi:hypothetical protein
VRFGARRRLAILTAVAALCLAAIPASLALGARSHGPLLSGRTLGISYRLTVDRDGRAADHCVKVSLSTTHAGAAGCADPAGPGHATLSTPGLVCDGTGLLVHGVAPSGTAAVVVRTAAGRRVLGRTATLPARVGLAGDGYVIAVARARPTSVQALGRHGRVLATARLAAGAVRCPGPAVTGHGHPHRSERWTWALTTTRAVGGQLNLCDVFDSTTFTHDVRVDGASVSCARPDAFAGGDWVSSRAVLLGCTPGYQVFTGLVTADVTRVRVQLSGGGSLPARLTALPPRTHLRRRAFVASAARTVRETALVARTRDGETLRFSVPPAQRVGSRCVPGTEFFAVTADRRAAGGVR